MPTLSRDARLQDYQRYVAELERERGFLDQSLIHKCLLLGEEIGELFKAVRRVEGLSIDVESPPTDVEGELADILIYVCAIANRLDVDLERAFREKEETNKGRSWE